MAYLMLADGHVFSGEAIGASGYVVGEMVFNTAQTGYQEILTDPSYAQQIITFTTAHIGNVGVNRNDNESSKVHAQGAIFREVSSFFSNWRGELSLLDFIMQHQMVCLTGVDTRALTIYLREKGSQHACLVTDDAIKPADALELAKKSQMNAGQPLASLVSTKASYVYVSPKHAKAHVAVVDCGVKQGILEAIASWDITVSVVPMDVSFTTLLSMDIDGVVLSNGPGNPEQCTSVIVLTKQLLAAKIPVFGICLGHQILALASNARITKMKFGHHGSNHPILCRQTGKVFISSQNHGFVVDEHGFPEHLEITHVSLFDGTIAGLKHKEAPAFSFQGHPEASPGPHELHVLFQHFMQNVLSHVTTVVL